MNVKDAKSTSKRTSYLTYRLQSNDEDSSLSTLVVGYNPSKTYRHL